MASTTMNNNQPVRDDEWRAIVSRPLDIPAFQPLSSAMGIEAAAASSSGKARSKNTDHYLVVRFGRLQETMLTSLAAADLPTVRRIRVRDAGGRRTRRRGRRGTGQPPGAEHSRASGDSPWKVERAHRARQHRRSRRAERAALS